jgi:chromatin structure-remodeling complex protein RSC7
VGGWTTLFGGPSWGPYSDGPLNVMRMLLLNHDGLNENRMFIAARTHPGSSSRSMEKFRTALSEDEQARGSGTST